MFPKHKENKGKIMSSFAFQERSSSMSLCVLHSVSHRLCHECDFCLHDFHIFFPLSISLFPYLSRLRCLDINIYFFLGCRNFFSRILFYHWVINIYTTKVYYSKDTVNISIRYSFIRSTDGLFWWLQSRIRVFIINPDPSFFIMRILFRNFSKLNLDPTKIPDAGSNQNSRIRIRPNCPDTDPTNKTGSGSNQNKRIVIRLHNRIRMQPK